jgi:hypothetical protein
MKIHIEGAFSPVPKRLSLIFAFLVVTLSLDGKVTSQPRYLVIEPLEAARFRSRKDSSRRKGLTKGTLTNRVPW